MICVYECLYNELICEYDENDDDDDDDDNDYDKDGTGWCISKFFSNSFQYFP